MHLDERWEWYEVTTFGSVDRQYIKGPCNHLEVAGVHDMFDQVVAALCMTCDAQLPPGPRERELPDRRSVATRLTNALTAVLDLHQQGAFPDCRACGDLPPCPTVRAIVETLGVACHPCAEEAAS